MIACPHFYYIGDDTINIGVNGDKGILRRKKGKWKNLSLTVYGWSETVCKKWSLVNTVRIFLEDTKMEFGLPKCGVLIMKKGKVVKSERKSMPNRKMMKKIEESA